MSTVRGPTKSFDSLLASFFLLRTLRMQHTKNKSTQTAAIDPAIIPTSGPVPRLCFLSL
uniref:Uncharacterized protein n=1 Tax=Arundo donax TaxID=35708 RepID=A0A0A8Z9H2_ARUDO